MFIDMMDVFSSDLNHFVVKDTIFQRARANYLEGNTLFIENSYTIIIESNQGHARQSAFILLTPRLLRNSRHEVTQKAPLLNFMRRKRRTIRWLAMLQSIIQHNEHFQ
jgi:hypothetical protein